MFETLKQKSLAVGFGMLAVSLLVAGTGFWSERDLAAQIGFTERAGAMSRSHLEADMMHEALRADVLAALLSSNPAVGIKVSDVKKDVAEHSKTFSEAVARSRSLASSDLLPALDALEAPLADYEKAATTIVDLAISNPSAATAALPGFMSSFERLEKAMGEVTDQIETAEVKAEQAADQHEKANALLVIASLVATLLANLGLILFLNRSVVSPLSHLTVAMKRLAEGQNNHEVPGQNRPDEIGAMARATETFRLMGESKTRLETEAEQARARADADRDQTDAEARHRAASDKAVVDALAHSLGQLAQGDLTCAINQEFPAHYQQIKTDFNAAIGSLAESMQMISNATGTIRGGSEEIANATNDLCKRTEQQAASLEETAAALDEITATVKRSADGAKQAASAASGTKFEAEQSGAIVSDAVLAMGEIRDGSNQISQIIGVIDEIAFQTNLLALNAGVEAARAGDAGRGFAVVAQEVRALAQRSAEAAKEIKTLISSSSAQVERGVKLVDDTGQALVGIVGKVAEIDSLIREIAQSSQEQATALAEVNSAVNQMDQITQQNAAMVEEATAAATNLKSETGELARTVGRFRITGGAAQTTPRLADLQRHTPGRNPVAQAQARIKTFANGALATASADTGWDEF